MPPVALVARRGDQRVLRLRPQELVAGSASASQPSARPSTNRTIVAVVGDEDVAVDVQRGRPSRTSRATASRVVGVGREAAAVAGRRVDAGSAARTGRRRRGCRGRRSASRRNVPIARMSSPQLGAVRDADPGRRALARVVGRAPAPEDVLLVDDQQVARAPSAMQLRAPPRCAPAAFVPSRKTRVAFLRRRGRSGRPSSSPGRGRTATPSGPRTRPPMSAWSARAAERQDRRSRRPGRRRRAGRGRPRRPAPERVERRGRDAVRLRPSSSAA